MIDFLCAFILGLIFYVLIRNRTKIGFISCHAIEGVIGAIVLGVMTGDLSRFQGSVLIYFVLWSWWVFLSSVLEHSLTLRILNSLKEIQLFKTYDMSDEFILRVEKLVRSGIIVRDESRNLYSVKKTSCFYRFDLFMKWLFRIENNSLY